MYECPKCLSRRILQHPRALSWLLSLGGGPQCGHVCARVCARTALNAFARKMCHRKCQCPAGPPFPPFALQLVIVSPRRLPPLLLLQRSLPGSVSESPGAPGSPGLVRVQSAVSRASISVLSSYRVLRRFQSKVLFTLLTSMRTYYPLSFSAA